MPAVGRLWPSEGNDDDDDDEDDDDDDDDDGDDDDDNLCVRSTTENILHGLDHKQ